MATHEQGTVLFVGGPVGYPDPPLKNPYMEGIEAVEGILQRLQTFATSFPKIVDSEAYNDYRSNLLEVRDTLHRFRQAEMATATTTN